MSSTAPYGLPLIEVLRDAHETYQMQHELLWEDLLHVCTDVRVTAILRSFPWDFYMPTRDPMFRWMTKSVYRDAVMSVHRLWKDEGKKAPVLTLKTFRKDTLKWVKPQYLAAIEARLALCDPDSRCPTELKRVLQLRHNRLGHSQAKARAAGSSGTAPTTTDLHVATTALCQTFHALSFPGGCAFESREVIGRVEEELTALALRSNWSRVHDEDVGAWTRFIAPRLDSEFSAVDAARYQADLAERRRAARLPPIVWPLRGSQPAASASR